MWNTKKYPRGKYSFFRRKFIVTTIDEIGNKRVKVVHKTKSFDEFVKLLGSLEEANLDWYVPTQDEIDRYDFQGALVNDETYRLLKKKAKRLEQERKDARAREIIRKCQSIKPETLPETIEDQLPISVKDKCEKKAKKTDYQFFYITDIHLDFSIGTVFEAANIDSLKEKDLEAAIDRKASELACSFLSQQKTSKAYVLIGGDTSADPYVFGLFAKSLKERGLPPKRTFFVLGNHEIQINMAEDDEQAEYEKCVETYREAIAPYGMRILDNELYIPSRFDEDGTILKADQILRLTKQEAEGLFDYSPFALFGSMGHSWFDHEQPTEKDFSRPFAGKKSLEQRLAGLTDQLVKKLGDILPDGRTQIVLTHTPPHFWTRRKPTAGFYFVFGHVHHQCYQNYGRIRYYGDNMIGEEDRPLLFKTFNIEYSIDVFANVEDGIHEITPELYSKFNSTRSIPAKARKGLNHIYLVKKGEYCAFFGRRDGHNLLMLNGGAARKVDNQDLNYYFDHLMEYTKAAKALLKPFLKMRRELAKDVRSIGGDGIEHGAIVDIDMYNHVYLNPIDGKRTCYFALSTANKRVYPDISALLEAHCPKLLSRFKNLPAIKKTGWETDSTSSKEGVKETRTDIYRYSNLIYALEYIVTDGVIRVWVDELLSGGRIGLGNARLALDGKTEED